MNAWNSKNIIINAGAVIVDTPISKDFRITAGGATLMRIDSDIACKLQTSSDGGTTWIDAKSSALEGGIQTITIEPGDTAVPLRSLGRVLSTAIGSVSYVNLMQED